MIKKLQPQATTLTAKLFRGFSDPSRLAILDALRAGPLTVTEIMEATGLSQSNASNHLRCLRECGLVVCAQENHYVRYQLSDQRVARLLRLADELLADVAKGIYECTRYTRADERQTITRQRNDTRRTAQSRQRYAAQRR
jgi:DNA-binding transcriptional ArsR family regulator